MLIAPDAPPRPPPRVHLVTSRLSLRLPSAADAGFLLELLNDPDFVRFTGDRGIRDLAGAAGYATDRLLPLYQKHGYTLLVVELRSDRTPIGICGWVRRDYLDVPDLGYGYLRRFTGQGYAIEAAAATLEHGRAALGLTRVHAITKPDNLASMRLLAKLGFRLDPQFRLPAGQDDLLFTGFLVSVAAN